MFTVFLDSISIALLINKHFHYLWTWHSTIIAYKYSIHDYQPTETVSHHSGEQYYRQKFNKAHVTWCLKPHTRVVPLKISKHSIEGPKNAWRKDEAVRRSCTQKPTRSLGCKLRETSKFWKIALNLEAVAESISKCRYSRIWYLYIKISSKLNIVLYEWLF